MARKKKPDPAMADDETPPPDHNSAGAEPPAEAEDINLVLRQAAEDRHALERQMTNIQEKAKADLKSLKERLKKVHARIKAFIAIKEFDVAYGLWCNEKPETTQTSLANIRTACRALGVGEQGVLFPDDDAPAYTTAPKPLAAGEGFQVDENGDILFAHAAGKTSGKKGHNRGDNPHPPATKAYDEWDRGWLDGQRELAEQAFGAPAGAA